MEGALTLTGVPCLRPQSDSSPGSPCVPESTQD